MLLTLQHSHIEQIMARTKKSRKVGNIGVPKASTPRPVKTDTKRKRTSGNKSGTRQLIAEAINEKANRKANKDPKIGSKTPINLDKYKAGAKTIVEKPVKEVTYKTPKEELTAIENNKELDALLEKQLDQNLTKSEQAFVDKMTKRYADLCELMGISVDDIEDEEPQDTSEQDDPFAKLDAFKLDDFKD